MSLDAEHRISLLYLKSATKPLNVLIAFTRPLITEFADNLNLKHPLLPTTYGNDIVYCLKSHCGVRGYCRQKWVLQVQIICKFSNERMCTRKKDVERLSCGFEAILY